MLKEKKEKEITIPDSKYFPKLDNDRLMIPKM